MKQRLCPELLCKFIIRMGNKIQVMITSFYKQRSLAMKININQQLVKIIIEPYLRTQFT